MLEEFKNSKIIIILFFIFFVGYSINYVNASEYAWTTTPFSLTWTSVTNPILLDIDNNGSVDNIYSWSYSAPNFILTKILGNGTQTITISNHPASASSYYTKVKVYDNEIWLGSSNILNATVSKANIFTGTVTKLTSKTLSSVTAGDYEFMRATSGNGATIVMVGNYLSVQYKYSMFIGNQTTTLNSYTDCVGNGNLGSHAVWGSLTYLKWERNAQVCGYSTGTYSNDNATPAPALDISGGLNGFCNTSSCDVNNSGAVSTISPGITFTTVYKDWNIKTYGNGFNLPYGDVINNVNTYWYDYLVTPSTDNLKILNLHYKILDPTLTNPTPFALFDNSTDQYIIELGATTKYSSLPSLTNRAMEFILLDDYTGADYPTLASSSALTVYTPYLKTISTTYASVNTAGSFVLPSGYKIQVDSGTTAREIVPDYTHTETLTPSFLGSAAGLTSLAVNVRNAPDDFSLLFYDTQTMNGEKFLWSAQPLTADDSVTVDLPSSLCVTVVGVTTDTIIPEYTDFGNLCASGTMPKTIVYSQNLAFTFWTLPWGTAHVYNQGETGLITKVRHSTIPFSYNVNIFDRNGTTIFSDYYTVNSTGVDARLYNLTGVQLPARLEISDETNSTLYYSTVGFPSYLSGVSSFFIQWFTIDGFNLLYMLPIIFAAMFTRNSVGLGTGLTVAFIAVLAWLGVIVVNEIIIYLLIFIAVIGMIAYKLVRD